MKKFITILLVVFSYLPLFATTAKKQIELTGKSDFLHDGDTVTLTIYKYGIINTEATLNRQILSIVKNGLFQFRFAGISTPQYIKLEFKGTPVNDLNDYIIEPGSKIHLLFSKGKLSVSGHNCTGIKAQYKINEVENHFNYYQPHPHFNANNLENVFFNHDSIANQQRQILKKYTGIISKSLFDLLVTDIDFSADYFKYEEIYFVTKQYPDTLSNPIYNGYKNYQRKFKVHDMPKDDMICYSSYYIKYLVEKYKVNYCFKKNSRFDFSEGINWFAKQYYGILREQLIISLLGEAKNYPVSLTTEIRRVYPLVKNNDFKIVLNGILKRAEGENAFNFSLPNDSGRIIHLSDFKGKVVLLDFWFTGCGNCRLLAPYLSKIEDKFKNKAIYFVGVNTDNNKNEWITSIQSGQYVSSAIVNLNTNGIHNSTIEKYKIKDYPTLILITKKGTLINVKTDPRIDNGAELMTLIQQCLF